MRGDLRGYRATAVIVDDPFYDEPSILGSPFDRERVRSSKSPARIKEEKRLRKNRERSKGRHVRYESVQVDYKGLFEVKELRAFRSYIVSDVVGGGFVTNRGRDEILEVTRYLPDCDEVQAAIMEIRNAR